MAAEIKKVRGIDATLVPGSGGEFEIKVDGQLIWSKKAEGRFPDFGEVLSQLPA